MSVVVRMEMPNECEYCPMCRFYRENGRVWCNAANRILKQVWDNPDCTHLNVKKPSWCPIICQLPEGHGRLVGSDQVAKMIDRWIGYLDEDMIYRIKFALNRDVPTIVPAEMSEE